MSAATSSPSVGSRGRSLFVAESNGMAWGR
jgi:hypothetical protein